MSRPDDRQRLLRLGAAIYDLDAHALMDEKGQQITLREKSLRVLSELAEQNGATVEKDALIDAVWSGRAISDDSLVQCIKDIRRALGDRDRQLLHTAVGRGYSLHGVRCGVADQGHPPKLLISALRSMGDAPDLAELADIITEELIVSLSPRAGLNVTTNALHQDTVDYAISGRVRRTGDTVRVFMQLVREQTGDVAFAQSWDVPSAKTAPLPGQIADKIGSILRIHMFNYAGEDHINRNNADLDTQQLMSKAAYHMSRIQMQSRAVAREAVSLAVEREPQNAMALAMRAATSVILVLQEGIPNIPDAPEYCLDLADRAVGLAPHVDFVMLVRGSIRMWLQADHAGARADYQRALDGNPVFHLAHQFYAISEILSGEHALGVQRLEKIMTLGTENNPRYPHYLALLALGQLLDGDMETALQTALEGYERAPSDPWCNYVYATAAADQGPITQSPRFKRMIERIALPLSHYRDLPFTDAGTVDMLEDRLLRAGYPRP